MLSPTVSRMSYKWQLPRLSVSETLLRQVVLGLVVAALLEIVLLRLTTRIGVHVPRSELAGDGLQAASFVGSFAFNSASILAIVLTVLLLLVMTTQVRDRVARFVLAAISGALMISLAMSLVTGGAAWDGAFGLAATLAVLMLGVTLMARKDVRTSPRVAVALVVGAYLCYQYYSLSHIAYRLLDYAALPPLGIDVLRWGEVLVVLAGAAVFWAWGRPRWRLAGRVGIALVVGFVAVVGLSTMTPSSTTSILALWTTGMSFFLPSPVYLLSLALYLVTVVACFRDKDAFWLGTGLLLLLVAGYMPEATYHHLLIILGVGFLAGTFNIVEEASERTPAPISVHAPN
ncbi:MAG: hypothetical protein IIC90_02065 [Chloroflexi bacterium]|nr:hypothetical protein [Chloroflexota bacterium]